MAAKAQFNPRKLMEKAIEVMRQSVNEPRVDNDAPPKVGAVLWKPDGTIETGCRGELRYGDHAKFTLLERKNRSNRLDGAILFATLEPCGPGARNHPKLGCAERIVNARIKDVWLGVQDPHPKVAGKGLEFLKRHGVVVHSFDRDLQEIIVPGEVIQWLKDKLPNPIERSGAQRKEANEKFFELVREGIVNALVHRDYGIKGAKCQLVVTSDTVVIRSPGGPIEPITLEQLRSFNAPMVSRNPILHVVFAKMELAEERGLGLKSMRQQVTEAGLPLPNYTWEDPYLVLTLFRSPASAVRGLSPEVLDRLNDDEKASWQFIAGRESVTSSELMKQMGFDERKAQRVLKKLRAADLLRPVGKGPATRYEVVRP